MSSGERITIVGAGLAGSLLAVLLAHRGQRVTLYERLPDQRRERIPAGRSINLALAARGIRALELAGVMQDVLQLLIPMPGRLLHALDGALTFIPYGQREHEVIYSVSRPGLNRLLLDAAENAGVDIRFRQAAVDADLDAATMTLRDMASGDTHTVDLHHVIATDGAGSVLRHALVRDRAAHCTEDLLEHGYKELTLAADLEGRHRIEKNALHIWPRGGFMLIALPNLDGTFTVTLFLPHQGAESFATLNDPRSVQAFFSRQFADASALMPTLAEEFMVHPTGVMGTVRCERWADGDQLLLLGDAAHAITPFHGQGMNCAFEDCRVLDEILARQPDWTRAFEEFQRSRIANANAIADMALENYLEMRDTVRDPKFQLQKALSLDLERRFPERFVPRYSMVMFHDTIAYDVAYRRGIVQASILRQLTANAEHLQDVDLVLAQRLIESQLEPIEP